ncbi:unnamed protein product [Bathycoccus prasinos]
MQTRSSAAANAEKPYGDVSFTLESGLSTDEILRKSDSSSAIVWDEFESEKSTRRPIYPNNDDDDEKMEKETTTTTTTTKKLSKRRVPS